MTVDTKPVERLLRRWEANRREAKQRQSMDATIVPIVTVSAQTGSRADEFATALSKKLGYEFLAIPHIDLFAPKSENYERVLSLMDDQFRASLPELISTMDVDLSDESHSVRHHCQLVLCLAELGGVVLLDWGASKVLGHECGLHIRLLCPNATRAQNMANQSGLPIKEARKLLRGAFEGGYLILMKYLRWDVWIEMQYDLLLNSGYMGVEELAEIGAIAAKSKSTSIQARRSQHAWLT